jgi:adenylosuccinate synthase
MKQSVDVVIGGQYGSEAKGKICGYLSMEYKAAVRGGAENAGHSIVHAGKTYKMQVIPVAWVNPKCKLYIGAGAVFSVGQLQNELYWTSAENRLRIDPNAVIIQERHKEQERALNLDGRIGSTVHGCGAALADKMMRNGTPLAKDVLSLEKFTNGRSVGFNRVSSDVAHHIDRGEPVMLEGTQGTMLSIDHTLYYPFATSRNVTASAVAAEVGVPPHAIRDVIMVVRTYPIRVGGNSGPTSSKELTWAQVSRRAGRDVIERTTVTNKVRRIFEFSWHEVAYAAALNRPTMLALTFIDYFGEENVGAQTMRGLNHEARKFVQKLEDQFKVPVGLISTGPRPEDTIDRRRMRLWR